MRKSMLAFYLLISITMLAGCRQDTLKLPAIDDSSIIVTHVKTPLLTVIDREEQQVVHEEKLGFVVHAAARIDRDQLVLATSGDPAVRLLDLTDGTLQSLSIPASEVTCLYVERNREQMFIADAKQNQLIIYDFKSDQIVEQLETEGRLNAMDADDRFLYVLNGNAAAIQVINLTTYEVVRTFPVLGHPTTIVVSGDDVWVGGHGATGELNKHVYIYEADSGELKDTVQAGTMPIALYHDDHSRDLFVLSHGSNELHVIDMDKMEVKGKLTTADNPFYLVADEQFIYVTALDGDSLTMIDRETYEVKEHYKLAPGPYGIVLGGDAS